MTALLFILLLIIIISVHEFGHFLAAKLFNVYVSEFSIGMGPAIKSWQGKETKYSIRAIPLGGYCAMAGDSDNPIEPTVEEKLPKERTLNGIHPLKKIIVLLAGIFMNVVLAFVIVAVIIMINGNYGVSPDNIVDEIMTGYPAETAGMKAGDEIVEIGYPDGSSYKVEDFADISTYMSIYKGEGNVFITVLRDGKEMTFELKPLYEKDYDSYKIGISSTAYNYVKTNFFNSWYYAGDYLKTVMSSIFQSLGNLLRGVGFENVSGPVGIYNTTREAVSYGASYYFLLLGTLSLNVGFFNALPLPIMDGGRVLLTIIEVIIRRPIDKKLERAIMSLSTALLLLLVLFVTFKDIVGLL